MYWRSCESKPYAKSINKSYRVSFSRVDVKEPAITNVILCQDNFKIDNCWRKVQEAIRITLEVKISYRLAIINYFKF